MKRSKWYSVLRAVALLGMIYALSCGVTALCADQASVLDARYGPGAAQELSLWAMLPYAVMYWQLRIIGTAGFSLISGYRLEIWCVLGLGLHRNREGRLGIGFRRMGRPCQQVLLSPPSVSQDTPYVLHHAAPVLMTLLTVVLLAVLAAVYRAEMACLWLLAGSAAGLVRLAVDLLPRRDGRDLFTRLALMRNNWHVRRAYLQKAVTVGYTLRTLRTVEMPQDLFGQYPEEELIHPEVYAAALDTAMNHAARGQLQAAYDGLCALLRQAEAAPPQITFLLDCTRTLLGLLLDAPVGTEEELYTPNMELFMGPYFDRLLVTRYAYARLRTHDAHKAAQQLVQLEAVLNKTPQWCGKWSKEMLSRIRQKAAGLENAKEDTQE